jgi:hypothetical protein
MDPSHRYDAFEVSLTISSCDNNRSISSPVKAMDSACALRTFFHQLFIKWQERLARQHLLFFGIMGSRLWWVV